MRLVSFPASLTSPTLYPKSLENSSGGIYMVIAKVLLTSLCLGVGSMAFATDPAPPATPAATAPASADAASTADADKAKAADADKAKSAATDAKTAPGGITADQAKTLRIAGYKASVQKGGEVVYCRSEPKQNSLIEEKVCGRPDDILLSIATSKDQVKQMQRANH
jgi:hypothetical protein